MLRRKYLVSAIAVLSFLTYQDDSIGQARFKIEKDLSKYSILSDTIMNKKVILTAPPKIESKLKENMTSLSYTANLVSYDKDWINYLVFYEQGSKRKELFRIQIKNSGSATISDINLLKEFKNNQKILTRVEAYKLTDKSFKNPSFSYMSEPYYTSKTYNLSITEDKKVVYSDLVVDTDSPVRDGKFVIDFADLKKYTATRYYSYDNAKISVDDKSVELKDGAVELPYQSKEIRIDLGKNQSIWNTIKLEYPSFLNIEAKTFDVKSLSSFGDFRLENQVELDKLPNVPAEYAFSHYEVNGQDIKLYNNIVNSNLTVKAIYNTKISIIKDKNEEVFYLKTGDKLSSIDKDKFNKEGNDIVSYDIIDNISKKKESKTSLEDINVDKSITIVPVYEPKKYKLMLRQDSYNKRFGKVDKDLENLDVEWPSNKPLSEFTQTIKSKIKPSDGYDLEFRVAREKIRPDQLIKEDTLLEIYFKKKEGDWVKVVFAGEGIDKFLSDGQEVLAGQRIDSINLPTSQGTSKEFVGWTANRDYKYQINNKLITKKEDSIIKTVDLPHVVTSKGQDLIFTAKYLENYKISLSAGAYGKLILVNSDNTFEVKEGQYIRDVVKDNRLILNANSHFQFSHFTADHDIMVRDEKSGIKVIRKGQRISLKDFYNIIVRRDLNIKANFDFYDGGLSLESPLLNHGEDLLSMNIEKDYNDNIEAALGPLSFLR